MYAKVRLMNPVESKATRLECQPEVAPTGIRFDAFTAAPEQSFVVGLLARGPKTLRYCKLLGVTPSGWVTGDSGVPSRFTTFVDGVAVPIPCLEADSAPRPRVTAGKP